MIKGAKIVGTSFIFSTALLYIQKSGILNSSIPLTFFTFFLATFLCSYFVKFYEKTTAASDSLSEEFVSKSKLRDFFNEIDKLEELSVNEMDFMHNYLDKTSQYLLGNTQDQADIFSKIESNHQKSKEIISDIELKLACANKSSTEAQEKANDGREKMKNLSSSVDSLKNIESLLIEVVEVFHNLAEKMKGIDGIVFMSKLISFNATIESARLGRAGDGMAVVALEMTKLSQQIGETSNEIQGILQESSGKIDQMKEEVHENLSSSVEMISNSQENFNIIIDNIFGLSGEISQISGAVLRYNESNKVVVEVLQKLTQTTNTLGTAASNCKLTSILLAESKQSNFKIIDECKTMLDSESDENENEFDEKSISFDELKHLNAA